MTKKILLIFESTKIESILISNVSDETLIITGSQKIKDQITNLGYNCKTINNYSKNSKYENEKAIEWIKSWPDKPIIGDKSFKELLVYDKFSIFWFLESRFYYYRIQSLIPLIEQIKNMMEQENPLEIFIHGNIDVYKIIKQKYDKEIQKIEFSSNKKNTNSISHKSYSGNQFFKLLALKFFRGLKLSSTNNSEEKPILIITEMGNWRPDYDYEEGKIIHRDTFFHNIVKQLKNSKYPIRIIDYENQAKRLLKSKSLKDEREKEFGVPVESWENYISLEIIKKTRKFSHELEQLWNKISITNEFDKTLTYENFSLPEILKTDIEYLLKSFKSYMSITFIETSKRIIDTIKPSIILMHDEYGALQLSIIKEAQKRNIPTVSIQHGANTASSISYIHSKQHIVDKSKYLNFLLPQKICVWSEQSKDILIKQGNFPDDIPIITGDPKTDFLPNVIKQFNHEQICQKLKIPTNKKILVFVTQPLPNIEEKEIITNSIFKIIKNFDNVFLVIKVHPRETDLSFYKNMAEKFNVRNYSIQQFSNLYEILFISNIVLVAYSTAGIEAMRMKKPVISLDMMGLNENQPLLKSGIPIIANSEDKLISSIKKCLESENVEKMIHEGQIFAEKELGKADGQSSTRIVNLIKELTRNNSQKLF